MERPSCRKDKDRVIAILHFLLRLLYRFRGYNTDVLKTPGPVLLIPNHTSWLDWLFVGVFLDKDWRFVTSSVTAEISWLHRKMMVNRRTYPIDTSSPYAAKHMAEFLQKGGRLVLFAEGRLSMTGTLMKLFDGTGFLLHKTNAKVVAAYLRNALRIPWVRHTGWTQWFPRVTAHFSDVLTPPKLEHVGTTQARAQLTLWLRDQMVRQQFDVEMEFGPDDVLSAVAETARNIPGKIALEDATRKEMSYRTLMTAVRALANSLAPLGGESKRDHRSSAFGASVIHAAGAEKIVPAGSIVPYTTPRIGVLLPNVNSTPVVILALWAAGKVPAVLNFSTGTPVMLACAELAGLKTIITSKLFLERAKIDPKPFTDAGIKLIHLEDVLAQIGTFAKFRAALCQRFAPRFALRAPRSTDPAVILFTSGSEGMPKGVELTHRNLMSNIRQMLAVTDMTDNDRIFNALPIFHSFGLTVGTLLPLVRGFYTFIYPSPLHYRMVPAAVYDRDITILLGTNTFLNGYARKAHPYDFRALRYLFAGAEKVQEATAAVWAQRFGTRILEGYGATECSPCVSVCVPMEPKHGSGGRFMPGMEWKLEPVEGVTEGGRLFVRGPNVMKGYLNADANAKFLALGGWYDTGDIVRVDEQGFVHILGRLKRFAKVSGEMVSLTAVEDALAGAFPQYGIRCQVAVLARPDEEKGERLIAVTNESKLTLDEIRAVIRGKGLTNLCVPREVKFVREIPKLGTGKVNHRELAKMI